MNEIHKFSIVIKFILIAVLVHAKVQVSIIECGIRVVDTLLISIFF